MDDQLEPFGAQDRVPSDPLVARAQMPAGTRPQEKGNPAALLVTDDLIKRSPFRLAGTKGVLFVQELVKSAAGCLLQQNLRAQRSRVARPKFAGWFFHPNLKWAFNWENGYQLRGVASGRIARMPR